MNLHDRFKHLRPVAAPSRAQLIVQAGVAVVCMAVGLRAVRKADRTAVLANKLLDAFAP